MASGAQCGCGVFLKPHGAVMGREGEGGDPPPEKGKGPQVSPRGHPLQADPLQWAWEKVTEQRQVWEGGLSAPWASMALKGRTPKQGEPRWREWDAAARPSLEREEDQEEEGNLPPPCGRAGLLHLPTHQLPDQGGSASRGWRAPGCRPQLRPENGWGSGALLGHLLLSWRWSRSREHVCVHTYAHTDMFIQEILIKHVAPELAPGVGNTTEKAKQNKTTKPALRTLTFLAKGWQ